MKKLIIACAILIAGLVMPAHAQKGKEKEESLKPYYLVLLKKGPNRNQDSVTAAKIQKEHMEHINQMAADGKLNVAGPFLDDGELRGIFIFDVSSEEEVKLLVQGDPAVKAGRLAYEIHPWMTQKGTCFK